MTKKEVTILTTLLEEVKEIKSSVSRLETQVTTLRHMLSGRPSPELAFEQFIKSNPKD